MGEVEEEQQTKFTTKKRNLRKRKSSVDSEDDGGEIDNELIEDFKEIRKLRKRANGIDAIVLSKVKAAPEEDTTEDPLNLKEGGMINLSLLKGTSTGVEEFDSVTLGNTFSSETNSRNEDADMVKYIEKELAKRKGIRIDEEDEDEDGAAVDITDELHQNPAKQSEDMLSNQMLSGIPEVDLGIHERIRNIEATEEAKLRLKKEKENKKDDLASSFVPVNMAVNFNRHNKFNLVDLDSSPFKKPVETRSSMVEPIYENKGASSSEKGKKFDMASDDFVLEKFKRQYRKR